MTIVFFGSADFAVPSLDALAQSRHRVCAVVTTPPRPRGRGLRFAVSPVSAAAARLGIDRLYTPDSLNEHSFVEELASLGADLFVVVAYRILPEEVFTLPPQGTYNVHASLLPAYRGPAPIHRAIASGERVTGVTVFKIDSGIDTGALVLQRSCPIGDTETTPQLYERLSSLGAQSLLAALDSLEQGAPLHPQSASSVLCHAPKLRKEESRIDWGMDAGCIFNRIRAFKPFPGTHTLHGGKRLALEWGIPSTCRGSAPPGTVLAIEDQGFLVACGSGALELLRVRPEGKGTMDGAAYARGARLKAGERLG